MLPRWHILFGALFGLFLWIVWPRVGFMGAFIAFLASFLIDFDHYLGAACKTRKLGLLSAFEYYRIEGMREKARKIMGIRQRRDFQIFHTIEFHLLILIIGIWVWPIFLWIFIGMLFHSILDIIQMAYEDALYIREYSLFKWAVRRI